ncbi:carboxymuconolactone decarboxylase family protein [Patulibacter sp.]|uniref:carboxymuconolactone decarboxylase family protein n=1 Tax=Patulibacter sp. TaxID=1912859 RepID=UPI002720EAF9|nr:carboxymuconolactone decarboxylase family protein [Patulibacter sp.]MDO9408814.1 carboxymuconolactone decarboxylase family protein [Patulibacter sp.]
MTTDTPTTDHGPRLDVLGLTGPVTAAMARVEGRLELDPVLRELIKLRASQINGCAFCLDMHWTDAKAAGESDARLAQLAAHAESPFFDLRERAVLALTDAVTRLEAGGVPDAVWAEAERHLDGTELAHVLWQIAAINAWNRIAVSARFVPAGWDPAA